MRKWVFIIAILLVQSSCFTEEQPFDPVQPHQERLSTDTDTSGQVFYSLKHRKVVSANSVNDWDLAFECRENHYTILVNSARGMAAHNTEIGDFGVSLSPDNLQWTFDHPDSEINKTAIGVWGDFEGGSPVSYRQLYVLNLGVDQNGNQLGYKKFLIGGYTDGNYLVRFSDLDGSNEGLKLIPKDERYNFTYLSFKNNGQIVEIEPLKDDWDLCYTPYADSLVKPVSPEVRVLQDQFALYHGIISNPYNREVALDEHLAWEDVTYFGSGKYEYMNQPNAIGHQWYAWDDGKFEYRADSTLFCLRDHNHNLYLIRFHSFEQNGGSTFVSFQFKNL